MPLIKNGKPCTHPKESVVSKPHYSLSGRKLGEAKWCIICQGWVDRMDNG